MNLLWQLLVVVCLLLPVELPAALLLSDGPATNERPEVIEVGAGKLVDAAEHIVKIIADRYCSR